MIGLVLKFIGVFVLYRFGMPFRVRVEPGTVTWVSSNRNPQIEQENRRAKRKDISPARPGRVTLPALEDIEARVARGRGA